MNYEAHRLSNIAFDDVYDSDRPDYSDAYISEADYDGQPLDEEQLEDLNEDRELVHELLLDHLS